MKLSKRLQKIADFVPLESLVADIGTDHGYIPAYLINSGKCTRVIGTDISKGSLDKIIQYVKQLNYEDYIESRLGNGLEVIKENEVDTVIIAGMGGLLIRDILEKDVKVTNSISNFILQPMIAAKELREYLINNNYKIIDEELLYEEKKYYEIIYAIKGKSAVENDIDYEISPILVKNKHPLLLDYIDYKIQSAQAISKGLEKNTSIKSQARYLELNKLIEQYRGVRENLKS